MALSTQQKHKIKQTIENCLRAKFKNYAPKNNAMPFHYRLLGKDRMALYSFMQSLFTTFGTSIFEPVAAELASNKFKNVFTQYKVGNEIYADCQRCVQEIINKLSYSSYPDKEKELRDLASHLTGKKNKLKAAKVDLYLESNKGELFLIDLKSAKPNKGEFQKFKQTLLEWAGIVYTTNPKAKVNTLIAIPYNPYEPQPYSSWTMAGMLDRKEELKVAEDFWDFLGGKGAYNELLNCFEDVGIMMRTEIDDYFARYK